MRKVYKDWEVMDVVQNRRKVVKNYQIHGFLVLVADYEKDLESLIGEEHDYFLLH